MRYNILTKHSTKSERILYEILKELKIPFKHRWKLQGRKEIDFLCGNVIIEIDGHEQEADRNNELASLGYDVLHFTNREIYNNRERIRNIIKNGTN